MCDDPDYFYGFVDGLYAGLGWRGAPARDTLTAVQARGLGYAISTDDELAIVQVSVCSCAFFQALGEGRGWLQRYASVAPKI